MNRLEAYVRRTIKQAAKEGTAYYRAQGSYPPPMPRKEAAERAMKEALMDATRGTDTGWWSDLIYTRDVYRMAASNRKAIAEAVAEYLDETGSSASDRVSKDRPSFVDVLAACTLAPSFNGWTLDGNGRGDDMTAKGEAHADALVFGLRFAVEWYAGKMGSEFGL